MDNKRIKKKKILVVGHLDGLANSVRPKEIKRFLKNNGYDVNLFNDKDPLFLRAKESFKNITRRQKKNKSLLEYYRKYPLIEDKEAFAETLMFYLSKKRYDAIICSSHASPHIFRKEIDALTIYDCPTPVTFEIKNGYEDYKRRKRLPGHPTSFFSQFNPKYIRELEKIEREIYRKVDYLCFHWESYAKYIKKNFYNGSNLFILNWGCQSKRRRAKWSKNPRIAFFGNLRGYWVDRVFLSFLTKTLPYRVECYGNLKPGRHAGINVKGLMPNPDVLSKYQFGLVALKEDELKKHGFSSKTLDYAAYGLPSLLPKWHTIKPSIGGCIYYNKATFFSQIETYCDKKKWKKKSDQAYEYAQLHDWNRTLSPLLKILGKHLR